jgi:hypothetical protein
MPRPSIGETPMTGAKRQARYRDRARGWRAGHSPPPPGRPPQQDPTLERHDRRGCGTADRVAAWLDALPDNQQDSALAECLRTIVEFDLSELQAIEPPRGFGRDLSNETAPRHGP